MGLLIDGSRAERDTLSAIPYQKNEAVLHTDRRLLPHSRAIDFRLAHLEDIGLHYAETLRRWRENLFAKLERVRALGYSDEFIRMWEFYLCYCEGGFSKAASAMRR